LSIKRLCALILAAAVTSYHQSITAHIVYSHKAYPYKHPMMFQSLHIIRIISPALWPYEPPGQGVRDPHAALAIPL